MPSFAEPQLAAIVESSDDAIIGKDLNSIITSWNRGAERLFGYSAAEVIGQPITIIIPSERLAEEDYVMQRIRSGHRVEPFETVRRRKDGSPIDVSISVSPIADLSGRVAGAAKIARDITAQVTARRDTADARERLEFLSDVGAVLASSLDYMQTLDRAVHLALPRLGDYCNVMLQDEQGVLRHVGAGHVVREKEAIVRDLAIRSIEQRGVARQTFAEQIVATGRTVVVSHEQLAATVAEIDLSTIDPELVRLGNELAPFAFAGAPLLVLGRPVGAISFGTSASGLRRDYAGVDVSLLEEFARRVSLAIENARLFRRSEELGRLKDEFLATLSHELRTPLGAILGWARMLATGQLDDARARQAVNAILRNAQAQAQLVDDVLDVARGMAGNLRLDLGPVDLVNIAHRGLDAIAPAAAAKRITVDIDAPAPVLVTGDAGRLQQIVWNLLSNAVKFTPTGGRITVAVSTSAGDAELRVTDSGAGIPPAFLPFVFDKFRQAEGSATRQHGGLGLGLAIARHLAEIHGGTIDAQSEGEGRGATFRLRLPLRAVDRQPS